MSGIRNPAIVALLLVLASCASAPPSGFGTEPDPVVRDAVAATARAVATRDVVVVVHVGHAVRAELRPDRSIHVWRGLLLRTRESNELAFALAHELAHDSLGHPFPTRGAAREVEQELAADAQARDALLATGFDPVAGVGLLQALRDEAATMGADPDALAELDRRIVAFGEQGVSYSVRSHEAWRDAWRERWRGWLAADPASADPQRRALIESRATALDVGR